MARLGSQERQYCSQHAIPLDRLFDAEGHKRSSYKKIMARDERWAAYGVTPCVRGHVLRTRHGSCLMCDPQTVAHMLRSKLPGYLYVATGGDRTLMKLGFSLDPFNRIDIANYEGWGGHHDWRVVARAWSARAGRLEGELHRYFGNLRAPLVWVRNKKRSVTKETFLADLPEACSRLVWLCDSPIEMF